MKIKELDKHARPREKAIYYGIDTLSNTELLALLLGNGGKSSDVLKIADELLKKSNGLSRITELGYHDLTEIRGIGRAQALRIMACVTIVKRSRIPQSNAVVNSPKVLVDYLQMEIGSKDQEYFYAVFLDKKKQICGLRKCFIGNSKECSVDQSTVFKEALQLGANSIILVHNHPSGNLVPSDEDYQLTNHFIEGANLLGITIMDHIIVSDNSYYSMADKQVVRSSI